MDLIDLGVGGEGGDGAAPGPEPPPPDIPKGLMKLPKYAASIQHTAEAVRKWLSHVPPLPVAARTPQGYPLLDPVACNRWRAMYRCGTKGGVRPGIGRKPGTQRKKIRAGGRTETPLAEEFAGAEERGEQRKEQGVQPATPEYAPPPAPIRKEDLGPVARADVDLKEINAKDKQFELDRKMGKYTLTDLVVRVVMERVRAMDERLSTLPVRAGTGLVGVLSLDAEALPLIENYMGSLIEDVRGELLAVLEEIEPGGKSDGESDSD